MLYQGNVVQILKSKNSILTLNCISQTAAEAGMAEVPFLIHKSTSASLNAK